MGRMANAIRNYLQFLNQSRMNRLLQLVTGSLFSDHQPTKSSGVEQPNSRPEVCIRPESATFSGAGLACSVSIPHSGAWKVDLTIDHRPGEIGIPYYLKWELPGDDLASPFGRMEHSLRLKPGLHTYAAYLPFRGRKVRGRLGVFTAKDQAWNSQEVPGHLLRTPALFGSKEGPRASVIHEIRIVRPQGVAAVPPNYILLPVTNYCNYKCVMCEHGIGAVPHKAHYPDELADRMIEFFNRAEQSYRVALTGLGESLMSPAFYRIVDAVKNPLVRFHFCSNAALLTTDRIDWILSSPFSHLNVSLDAASAETYHKIRRADWHRVIRNLEVFADRLAKSGRSDMRLILNMTLMKENLGEVKDFVALAKRLGASAYVNQLNYYPHHDQWPVLEFSDFRFSYKDQVLHGSTEVEQCLASASDFAREQGVRFKVEDSMRPLLDGQSKALQGAEKLADDAVQPIQRCPYPWVGDPDGTAVVTAEGSVQMCCLQSAIGRVDENNSLEQVWNGSTAQEVRQNMLEGKIPGPCANANCWFVASQRALEPSPSRLSLPLVSQPGLKKAS